MNNNKKMNKLAENLNTAESVAQEAQTIKPLQEEIDAIKHFCAEEIKRRSIIDDASNILKNVRQQQKNIKAQLLKIIENAKTKCMALSKADFKRLNDLCVAEKMPEMPPYLRLIQTNKDASITSEIIQEAIESISTEDLKEAEIGEVSKITALRTTILNCVRRLIRSYTESLKITHSLPKGSDIYELQEVTTETSNLMYTYWTLENQIRIALANKKDDTDKKELFDLKEKIETYFVRTGLTAQRVVVHKKPYRLVRRISVRKQKIGVGKFEKILDEVLESIKESKIRKEDLSRNLQIQLSSIPPDTKSQVVLCKMPED